MRRSITMRAAVAALATAGAFAFTAPAQAFELRSLDVGLTDPGTAQNPTPDASQLRAGAHPDVTINPLFPVEDRNGTPTVVENVKNVDVRLPRGLIVNPTAVPTCTQQQLGGGFGPTCPLASQVGQVTLQLGAGFEQATPLYNLVPPPGVPAQFGLSFLKDIVRFDGAVRTGGDYGLSARVRNIPQSLSLLGSRVELWGVPADPVHDAQRYTFTDSGAQVSGAAGIALKPFTSNPGRCTGQPLQFSGDATGWRDATARNTKTTDVQRVGGAPLTITGCDALPFDPSVSVEPTTSKPDSPTGLNVDVGVAQSESPSEPSSAHLKDFSVLLPEGMNVNPSAADGLTACSPAQVGLDREGPASCPDSSSIGSVTLDTPLLDAPLRGRVHLATQYDNPFGSTLAMYITASGSGVNIKLAGKIEPDPNTGRLRVTFADNPELPFSNLRVSLDGGDTAPLTTPASCGPQAVSATATSWSGGAARQLGDSFTIDCAPGLGGFSPGFVAGTTSPGAGLFSPLTVGVTRPDGQQAVRDLTVELPAGLLAKLRGVPLCGSVAAAAGTCQAASRIGAAGVTSGAGNTPFPLRGDVYLTGPYKGAPFGLSTRVRVVAGPLDLGTVVVRQALFLDSRDLRARIVSDQLPTILQGIPVRLRSLDINVDRPTFTVNPTSCSEKAVRGQIGSASGLRVNLATRFVAGNCKVLELKPKLNLRLLGKGGALRDGGHPALKAILIQGSGQSNLKRAEVKLPSSLALDPDNAQTLCEFAEGQKAVPVCPRGSVVGRVKARSPLLGQTLSGPVYFVKGQRTDRRTGRVIRTLPTLVVPLKGGGVELTLRARTAVSGSKLVTTFDPIPDASVSRFDLVIDGGKNGILVANSSVCSRSRALGIGIRGHNGALARSSPALAASCR